MEKYPALFLAESNQLVSLAKFGSDVCVIGRDPEASVQIPDLTCSRRQFSVVAGEGGYRIEPLSASVPTMRNGEPLEGPAVLAHNDKTTCGGTTMVFLVKEAVDQPATERGAGRVRFGGSAPPMAPPAAAPPPAPI